tara:strand:+ start:4778 stop:5731 length:954 start_codon:yes stop_codon:yes gene_type:complete
MNVVFYFVFLFCFFGCVDVKYDNSSGSINEILVVYDDYYNKLEIEKFLNSKNKNFTGLPQKERTFDITYIPSKSFKNIFKKQRCIILITKSDKNLLKVFLDKWANQQVVFCFFSKDFQSFKELAEADINQVFSKISETHADFLFSEIKTKQDKDIHFFIKEKFNLLLYPPKGFIINKEDSCSLWLLYENNKNGLLNNILIHTYPETSLKNKDILDLREKKLKNFIETQEGSYFMTETRYNINFEQDTSKWYFENSMAGLWSINGASMAGPFYSKIIRDTVNKRLIFLESFLFYPNENKRNLIIQNKVLLNNYIITNN